MQDRETDSYWPIMRGESLHGELKGTRLTELAVNDKTTWAEWRELHPDTLVLSVNGVEDKENMYSNYFESTAGFRDQAAEDTRADTKSPVFAFRLEDQPYAVRHENLIGGRHFELGGNNVYLFRSANDQLMDATVSIITPANVPCEFDSSINAYAGSECDQKLSGFDTFWYNWSLNNPETELME